MIRRSLLGLGLAALLTACAIKHDHTGAHMATPVIVVVNDRITEVQPDPLRFKVAPGQAPLVIHWDAPPGYEFAGDGIVINGEVAKPGGPIIDPRPSEVGQCVVTGNRKRVNCINKRSRAGIYKYTVLLQKNGQPLEPFDPTIMNT